MIVLDSSFLIGFYNKRDSQHAAAAILMDRFLSGTWGRGLLLEYVFVEIVTVLLIRRDLSVAKRVGNILLDAEELEFIPCSDLFAEHLANFSSQTGTRLSFVDIAIAGVARSRTDGQILSFDGEFRKIAGLRIDPESTSTGGTIAL